MTWPRLTITALVLLAGARAAGAQVLRYDDEVGSSRTYVREQRDRVVQTLEGREASAEIESHWRFHARVAAASPEALTLEVVHDSIAITGPPSAEELDLGALRGVPIEIVMTRRGAVEDVDVPTGFPAALARLDLATTYRSLFPRLPEGDADDGAAWSDTTRVEAEQNGLDLRVVRVNRYTSKGWATTEGGRIVRVEYEVELSIEGEGEQRDARIVLTGSGRGSGGYGFDPGTGAYLGGAETSEMRLVALVTDPEGRNVLIPILQNRTETITLIDPPLPPRR
jgi:hypothetical protein